MPFWIRGRGRTRRPHGKVNMSIATLRSSPSVVCLHPSAFLPAVMNGLDFFLTPWFHICVSYPLVATTGCRVASHRDCWRVASWPPRASRAMSRLSWYVCLVPQAVAWRFFLCDCSCVRASVAGGGGRRPSRPTAATGRPTRRRRTKRRCLIFGT
jgi:hypothetical protein